MWHVIETHRSPDAILALQVRREDNGDVSIGFADCSWHTHADILASFSGLRADEAVRQFVDDVIGGRTIIAVSRIGGQIRDVWVAEEPVPDKYKLADETIEFRYWDGRTVTS